MQVDDADLLSEFLEEQTFYSADFQALILKMVSISGNVQTVSQQSNVPVSTIYSWLSDWNKVQRLDKKKPYSVFKDKGVVSKQNLPKSNGKPGECL